MAGENGGTRIPGVADARAEAADKPWEAGRQHVIDPNGLSIATVTRLKKLFHLLCVPDDVAAEIIKETPVYVDAVYADEWSEEGLREDPGNALFALADTYWVADHDSLDYDFDGLLWAFCELLETHGMTRTLAKARSLEDAPEVAARFDDATAVDILRFLVDVQCDPGRRVILLYEEGESYLSAVVRERDVDYVTGNVEELFGPEWHLEYAGRGDGGATGGSGRARWAASSHGERASAGRAEGVDAVQTEDPSAVQTEGSSAAKAKELAGKAGRTAVRFSVRVVIRVLIGIALAAAFAILMRFLGVEGGSSDTSWQESKREADAEAAAMSAQNQRLLDNIDKAQTIELGSLGAQTSGAGK